MDTSSEDPRDVLGSVEKVDWDEEAKRLMAEEEPVGAPPSAPRVGDSEPSADEIIVIHLAVLSGGPPDFSKQMLARRGAASGGIVPSERNPSWAADSADSADEPSFSVASESQVPDPPSSDLAEDEDDEEPEPWVFGSGTPEGSDSAETNDDGSISGSKQDEKVARILRRTATPKGLPVTNGGTASPSTVPQHVPHEVPKSSAPWDDMRNPDEFIAELVADVGPFSDRSDEPGAVAAPQLRDDEEREAERALRDSAAEQSRRKAQDKDGATVSQEALTELRDLGL